MEVGPCLARANPCPLVRRPCGIRPSGSPHHDDDGDDDGDPAKSLWPFFRDLDLLRLLEDAAAGPASGQLSQDECRDDLEAYLQGLRNFSSWAVQSE